MFGLFGNHDCNNPFSVAIRAINTINCIPNPPRANITNIIIQEDKIPDVRLRKRSSGRNKPPSDHELYQGDWLPKKPEFLRFRLNKFDNMEIKQDLKDKKYPRFLFDRESKAVYGTQTGREIAPLTQYEINICKYWNIIYGRLVDVDIEEEEEVEVINNPPSYDEVIRVNDEEIENIMPIFHADV